MALQGGLERRLCQGERGVKGALPLSSGDSRVSRWCREFMVMVSGLGVRVSAGRPSVSRVCGDGPRMEQSQSTCGRVASGRLSVCHLNHRVALCRSRQCVAALLLCVSVIEIISAVKSGMA